ncbi:MAG: hypothetical protein ACXWLQ_08870 [Rhizomicrobium sp.]
MTASDNRVICKLTGEREMPRYAWLLDRLAALNPDAAKVKPEVFIWHAAQIYGAWLSLRHRADRTGYRIDSHTNEARRVEAKRGTATELDRLIEVAKGKSDRRWRTAWLGVSGATRDMVFKMKPPPIIVKPNGECWRADFDASGLAMVAARGVHMLMPRRADAVPLIEAALRKLTATPAKERSKRKPGDALADAYADAIKIAHHDLTGKRWGTSKLAREITEHLAIPLKKT